MLIATRDSEKIISIAEGTGDNLLREDIENGFVDYVLTSIYRLDGEEIILEDSGQLLLSECLTDLEEGEIEKRVLDYWELGGEDYIKVIL